MIAAWLSFALITTIQGAKSEAPDAALLEVLCSPMHIGWSEHDHFVSGGDLNRSPMR